MNVLVDTSIWSLALRRKPSRKTGAPLSAAADLAELVREARARIIGPIRQELLSGVPDPAQWGRLRDRMAAFPDLPLATSDYEKAAEFHNECRGRGVQGSHIDFLICAAASLRSLPIFTADADFTRYAAIVPISLYTPRSTSA